MKKYIYIKLILSALVIVGLNGCLGGQYYRQPLTTTQYDRQIETTTDANGKTSTKVITNEYTRTEPPPQSRYYSGNNYYSGGSYYGNRSYRGSGRSIRLCIFGCGGHGSYGGHHRRWLIFIENKYH